MSGNYIFDANGSLVGFKYRGADYASGTWDTYAYEKNIQGDIVAVYDVSTGTKLVSYVYNAWGDFEIHYHNGGENTSASYNRLTYRGYYYDVDLRMYYLKSRYYDPETGRFISPDNVDVLLATPTALTDKNLYLYCDNNPVMRVDEDGEFWVELGIMAVGGVIGAITNTATSYFSQKIISKEVDKKSLLVAAASGFVSGAISASPLGVGGQIFANGLIGGFSYIAEAHLKGEEMSKEKYFVAVATGAISGFIGGDGVNYEQQLTIAITKTRTTKLFASVIYTPREARRVVAQAALQCNKTIKNAVIPAVVKYVSCSFASNFVNTLFGKA